MYENTSTNILIKAKQELDDRILSYTLAKNKLDTEVVNTIKIVEEKTEELSKNLNQAIEPAENALSRLTKIDNPIFEVKTSDFTLNSDTGKYEYILEHNLAQANIQWQAETIDGKPAVVYIEKYGGISINRALVKVRKPIYLKIKTNRGYYGGIQND